MVVCTGVMYGSDVWEYCMGVLYGVMYGIIVWE